MPNRRHGRAARLQGLAGLIVCVACAAAAGPTLVPPDEAAGLCAVAELSGRTTQASHSPYAEESLEGGPPLRGADPESVAFQYGFLPDRVPAASAEIDLDDITGIGRLRPLDSSSFFTTDLPPVVRAQSPDISLLPLSNGDAPVENTSLMSWATGTKGRIRGDYLTDFDETDRIGVHALTQGWLGFGVDAEANYWQRPVADLGREPLWTGDLNVIYNLVPHPRFKFRSGIGAAWTVEDGKPHAGYNVTHGLDVYLLWRAMAIGEIDWGQLDDDKLFRYRLALGLTYDSFEFFTGYESYKLGGEKLDGWVNGVAWWY